MLNLGPLNNCVFCDLKVEMADHLFNDCIKTQTIWNKIVDIIGCSIQGVASIISVCWLDYSLNNSNRYMASLIASACWFIWKGKCNRIFKNICLDCEKWLG